MFRVTFKTPDSLEMAVDRYAANTADDAGFDKDSEEWEAAFNEAKCNALALAEQYVKYGEMVTIEFSLRSMSARVVK